MSTMKALVKREAAEGLWLEDAPIPDVGINDVFIQVLRTAICGTDLHIYNWDAWARKTIPVPMIIGHEFVGEVVSVGDNVVDFHAGEIVSGEGHVVCGRCRNCMAGRRHLCANTSGIGVNRPGSFAECVTLPMANIWEHRPGIDLDVASLFDPFGNAVHTALQFDLFNEDVLITGAGPIGCMLDEHEVGRDCVRRMEAALASTPRDNAAYITAAKEYVALLRQHIYKENNILFQMARQCLRADDDARVMAGYHRAITVEAAQAARQETIVEVEHWEAEFGMAACAS